MSGLVVQLQQLYEMYCVNKSIKSNKKMKYFLQENFTELICFTLTFWIYGNPIVVHALEVNPVNYVIASISETGLCDEEITISFAKMIHRNFSHSHNFPIICWKFICSNERETYIDLFLIKCKSFWHSLILDHIDY